MDTGVLMDDGGLLQSGGSSTPGGPYASRSLSRRRVCRTCGQHHVSHEPHVYDYLEEVDEDVTCHICLQPLVTPVDTPCGHTFCRPCLAAFLKLQQFCPVDRKPLTQKNCSMSSLVLKKLLEKLVVKCPNISHCDVTLPRGDLEDHLKYRCPGNWVACSYSGAGCDFRGPQKAMATHAETCDFKDQGVSRTPIVEGEISYIEIARTQTALGIAIVGGSDTPLRCVVIQEVFPDGLIACDGRLQAGDQIIEIDGSDMTTASHHLICGMLRRTTPLMRLGIYRERIDAYKNSLSQSVINHSSPQSSPLTSTNILSSNNPHTNNGMPPLTVLHANVVETHGYDTTVTSGHSALMGGRSGNHSLGPSPVHMLEGVGGGVMVGHAADGSVIDSVKALDESPDELVHVTLLREVGRQLGIKLGGRRTEPGIFIMELIPNSVAEQDGRLRIHDRILSINGGDVRYTRLDHAFRLIKQSQSHVSLIISRPPFSKGEYDHLFRRPHPDLSVTHSRTKSAPDRLVEQGESNRDNVNNNSMGDVTDGSGGILENTSASYDRSLSLESLGEHGMIRSRPSSRFQSNGSLTNQGKEMENYSSFTSLGDYPHEAMNRSNGSLGSLGSGMNKNYRNLTSPIRDFLIDENEQGAATPPALPPRSRQPLGRAPSFDTLDQLQEENRELLSDAEVSNKMVGGTALPASGCAMPSGDVVDGPGRAVGEVVPQHVSGGKLRSRRSRESNGDVGEITHGLRKSLKIEGGSQLRQKTVTISKDACESLGMRIGGGVQSNEGDTPIYIANIHPQGPVGKSKNVQKGDILLSVNGQTLLGLTHTQAVSLLKATAELAGVTLSLLEGPETSSGPANFVPSWLFWQRLPRALQLSKGVVLHRAPGASLGFSIVGGSDPQRGCEPIHVLFVVATSPAALDGRLRCGDRLLKVDGRSLEAVSHAHAVQMLKQAGHRVRLEVVSWMGTEI